MKTLNVKQQLALIDFLEARRTCIAAREALRSGKAGTLRAYTNAVREEQHALAQFGRAFDDE